MKTQENAVLRVGLELGIYDLLVQRESAVESLDVAKATGADAVLTERILRNLAALGHVDETGDRGYAANKITKAFTTPKGISGANFSYVCASISSNLGS